MDKVIELRKIIKEYGTERVLYEIDLGIGKGEFCSIIGQSGSGKSTLLNIMGTLDAPTGGEVLIDSISTADMDGREISRLRNEKLGFIFQFHHLLPEFSALENILMPIRILRGKTDKEDETRAMELARLVGIDRVINNQANEMSGGQQQRTAIARALINNPSVILADEPTGNLDSDTTDKVYELLRKINRELGTTLVVITHDRSVAERADRIIEILDGRIGIDARK